MSYRRIIVRKFGGPEVLECVKETALPEPKKGEVRIRVIAAGVSFTDTLIRSGQYPDLKDKPPIVPGYDLVGVVEKLGDGVTSFAIGDRVADLTVIGAYSEIVCLPAENLIPVPDSVDPGEAVSLILSGMTAYQMLTRKANVQAGQKILIHGAGGAVGACLLQLGEIMGLEMYATASPAKHPLITRYGAQPIDYRSEDFVQRIKELTGKGVDAVFDGIGVENFNRSFKTLRKGGTLVLYGAVTINLNSWGSRFGALFGMGRLFVSNWLSPSRSIDGYSIAARRKKNPDWFREDLQALFALLAQGKLRPMIDRRVSLDEIAAAHTAIERAEPKGRIVLTLSQA